MNSEKRSGTRDIAYIALFAAIMSVISQLSLPLPGGVPVTLQTFGAALVGYMLGAKKGTIAMAVYVLLGTAGMPVFAGLHGGIGSLTGPTGGFILGFIPMAFLCGGGADIGRHIFTGKAGAARDRALHIAASYIGTIAFGLLGLAVCHICGILQWSAIKGGGFWSSFFTVSAPFLLKDAVSVAAAFPFCEAVRKRVNFKTSPSRQA